MLPHSIILFIVSTSKLSLFRQLSYSTIPPATSSINMSVKSTLIEVVLFMTSIDSGLDSLSEEEKGLDLYKSDLLSCG